MKEKLFKLSVRFEQNGHWSDLKEDFIAYLLLDTETHMFIGYTEEKYKSFYDLERYVAGLLLEAESVTKLVFFKLVNNQNLKPIMYTFLDISQEGTWSAYRMQNGFDYPDGKTTITLEELEMTMELKTKVSVTYAKVLESEIPWNIQLLQQVGNLIDFL
jgi:hypothetical protein